MVTGQGFALTWTALCSWCRCACCTWHRAKGSLALGGCSESSNILSAAHPMGLSCSLFPCLQVCIYCTLLPLPESGVQLPAAVSKFMTAVSRQAAVKAGTEQVSRWRLREAASMYRRADSSRMPGQLGSVSRAQTAPVLTSCLAAEQQLQLSTAAWAPSPSGSC